MFRVYGAFDFTIRQYVFRDPEAFKRIAIKDFHYFEDRRVLFDEKMDSLFGNNLVSLHGEKWRQMRSTLSPAFTGSKMRQMFGLVSECADEIVKHFSERANNGGNINVDMKDFFSRYTNDVIASCAFGVKVNSFTDPNNDFFTNGKRLLNFFLSPLLTIKFLFVLIAPKIARTFRVRPIDPKIANEFKHMILDAMAARQNNNIYRPDMVNLLMLAREGNLKHQTDEKSDETSEGFATVQESDVGKSRVTRKWNDDELVAQCFLFLFAGFETTSTALSFAAYELVTSPDVQQKLYEEIAEVADRLDGKRISYDVLQKMKYLDQVVAETLRKWPITGQTDRTCVKPYLYDDGKLKIQIEKGSNIIFPVYGLHHDPKYYPNPSKFDPERFSDENKQHIVPGTYAPFGIGPRNCIGNYICDVDFYQNCIVFFSFECLGSRFAIMELKAILYFLLLNFSFEANKDTKIPLKMKKGLFISPGSVHLELKPRCKN